MANYQEVNKNSKEFVGRTEFVKAGDILIRKYTVLKKLGFGASSTVWLCFDNEKKHHVAIKILKPKYTVDGVLEIQFCSKVLHSDTSHPGFEKVVHMIEHFPLEISPTDKCVCIVFPALGKSILTLITDSSYKGIPVTSVKNIIKQILEGLEFLHSKCRMIHTDIKPENIVIDMDRKYEAAISKDFERLGLKETSSTTVPQATSDCPNVRIVDLGNACIVDSQYEGIIQTRPYRSIEVILGAKFSTPADIWSVACVAFELATGRLLFDTRDSPVSSLDEEHLAQMISILGDVPHNVLSSGMYSKKFFVDQKFKYIDRVKRISLKDILTHIFGWNSETAKAFHEFLETLLNLDPLKRPTASECLAHPWLND